MQIFYDINIIRDRTFRSALCVFELLDFGTKIEIKRMSGLEHGTSPTGLIGI